MNNYLEYILFIFSIGIVWGSLNQRIKHLEKEINNNRDFSERLTRIEEKVLYIAEHVKR